jgi:hypothetical protein
MAMSLLHTDDNLIEARLRQLEARTSVTGSLPPPPADFFWSEMPVTTPAAATAPRSANRWLGPLLGIVVGSVVTQMITAFGSSDTRPPASRTATVQTAEATAPTPAADPTTQALARLIAAKPAAATPQAPAERAIDMAEIVKLQQTRKLTLGRRDPFAVLSREAPPALPQMAALPPVQIIMPEPPVGPVATAAPKPTSQVRFNGSFALDGAYTALIEETSHGQTTTHRWRLGDTVLGGYRVAEISLRTLKLRLGGETIMLSAGSSQDLETRVSGSGLSAIAPEFPAPATGVRPAVWRPAPALPVRPSLSTPLATPLPPSVSEVPPVEEVPVSEAPSLPIDIKGGTAAAAGNPPGPPMQ